MRKTEKVMKFLTGLCQDDVTMSSGDIILGNKLHSHVREEISGKITKGILDNGYGSGVMQQKVGLGSFYPLGCVSVKLVYISRIRYLFKQGTF